MFWLLCSQNIQCFLFLYWVKIGYRHLIILELELTHENHYPERNVATVLLQPR
jgi:hypothetical protein